MIHQLVLLTVPIVFRQYEAWRATRIGKPKSKRLGGTPSVVIWFLAYVVLLVVAVHELAREPIGFSGWVGYAVLWIAIVLRSFAFHALRGFYDETIALREDHQVISKGVYRYLRHPLHLGLCFEMIGLALLGGKWFSLLILGAAFTALVFRNRNEERILEQHLGERYAKYRKTAWDVTDLIPRLRK